MAVESKGSSMTLSGGKGSGKTRCPINISFFHFPDLCMKSTMWLFILKSKKSLPLTGMVSV